MKLLILLLVQVVAVLGKIRVACVGDSITAGACAEQTLGYPAILQELLGSEFEVINFGNGGKTLLNKGLCGPPPTDDCSYVSTSTYQQALQSNPDILTIMLGTNDAKNFNWFGIQDNIADSYVLDYFKMINAFRTANSTKAPTIFIMTPVPLYEPYPFEMNSTVINTFLGSVPDGLIAQLAPLANVQLIDIHAAFKSYDASITCDGCHPTDQGYEVIAKTMEPFIRNAAGQKISHSKSSITFASELYKEQAQYVNRYLSEKDIKHQSLPEKW